MPPTISQDERPEPVCDETATELRHRVKWNRYWKREYPEVSPYVIARAEAAADRAVREYRRGA